jgi:hypothetical protein
MTDLSVALAECLSLHAEAKAKLGTEYPERLPQVPEGIRAKMARQRDKVSASLSGTRPEDHVAHVESLNAGLRLLLRRLSPRLQEPSKPPMPVWDAATTSWEQP